MTRLSFFHRSAKIEPLPHCPLRWTWLAAGACYWLPVFGMWNFTDWLLWQCCVVWFVMLVFGAFAFCDWICGDAAQEVK